MKDFAYNILDHLPSALLVCDRRGQVVYANEAASRLWQKDLQKLCQKPFDLLFLGDEILLSKLYQALRHGKEFNAREYQIDVPNLRQGVFEITISPVSEDGKIVNALVTLYDVSTQRDKQEREQQLRLNDAIGILASSMAHEIQNPLGGIKGATQLQMRDLEQLGISKEPSEMVLAEIKRIERLLEELLLHSDPLPLSAQPFNIHEVLETVLWFEENRGNRRLLLNRIFDPSLPEIEGDRDKLHQVFLNLIRNAIEASPEGGEVTIRSSFCSQWQLAGKHLVPQHKYMLIEVQDQGPGVDAKHIGQLFRPLFTTKLNGHGLGLSISYRIIKSHAGLLNYQPIPGGGALFQVYLPTQQIG
jgi:two-component system nitrogen regulation sensor histidine kinase GlnL